MLQYLVTIILYKGDYFMIKKCGFLILILVVFAIILSGCFEKNNPNVPAQSGDAESGEIQISFDDDTVTYGNGTDITTPIRNRFLYTPDPVVSYGTHYYGPYTTKSTNTVFTTGANRRYLHTC